MFNDQLLWDDLNDAQEAERHEAEADAFEALVDAACETE